jgi:D-galactarolactone isomerase
MNGEMARWSFLEKAGFGMLGAAILVELRGSHAQTAVPNSAGTELPKLKAPTRACDCHMHIYDAARFPRCRTS